MIRRKLVKRTRIMILHYIKILDWAHKIMMILSICQDQICSKICQKIRAFRLLDQYQLATIYKKVEYIIMKPS